MQEPFEKLSVVSIFGSRLNTTVFCHPEADKPLCPLLVFACRRGKEKAWKRVNAHSSSKNCHSSTRPMVHFPINAGWEFIICNDSGRLPFQWPSCRMVINVRPCRLCTGFGQIEWTKPESVLVGCCRQDALHPYGWREPRWFSLGAGPLVQVRDEPRPGQSQQHGPRPHWSLKAQGPVSLWLKPPPLPLFSTILILANLY